jgi:hypothetical protein
MKFRTEIGITPAPFQINFTHHILSLGSCFAEVMGKELDFHKFTILTNPFGTLFHPLSLTKILKYTTKIEIIDKNDFVQRDGGWVHQDFHSCIWAISKEILQSKIENIIEKTNCFLQKTNILIFTWGTAHIYQRKTTQQIVANCHKEPARLFEKKRLEIDTITEDFEEAFKILQKINPDIKIIISISPVRYSKENLAEDHLGKAILRVSANILTEKYPNAVYYFPSFEILNDDLRDYRFYKEDLIHPNLQAENYVWEKFKNVFFDKNTLDLMKKMAHIQNRLAHKPFNPESKEYRVFLEKLKRDMLEPDVKDFFNPDKKQTI